MKFSDLKVGVRIGLAFALVLLISASDGILAINKLGVIQGNVTDLATNWLPSVRTLGQISLTLNELRRDELRMVISEGVAEAEKAIADLDKVRRETLPAQIKTYIPMISSPEEEGKWKAAQAAMDAYFQQLDKMVSLRKAGNRAEYMSEAEGASKQLFDAVLVAVEGDIQYNSDGGDKSYADAQQTYSTVWTEMLVVLLLQLLIGAAVAWQLTRGTVQPLHDMVTVAQRVAAGDLSVSVDTSRKDELGQVAKALADMKDSLNRSIGTVRESAESIAMSSKEVAAGSSDLSARTEQMASSLEETSATMHTLTDTVKQNAEATRQASGLARNASQVAEQGGAVVGRVVGTMEEINTSSKKISDIIGVIDGIAFQTNILALNAAVEAARAGEQGRGFAVVASEVRSLAQRSATAAKEIKQLIDDSVQKVEAGSQLVAQAGSTMDEVVSSVRRVTDIVGEISSASQEQSAGITEVGNAVTLMDEATQQNAALVEEAAAAAKSLQEQAAHLAAVVAGFKLDESGGAAPVTPPPVHRPSPPPAAAARPAPANITPKPAALKAKPASKPALPAEPAAPAAPKAAPKAPPKSSGGDDWEEF